MIVVPTRGYPDLPIVVQLEAVEVDRHIDLLQLGEGLQVDDGDGLVVVGYAVATRVGDIELISVDDELVGLVAYGALSYDLEGGGIDLRYIAEACIGIDLDGASVGADVGEAILEGDVAAVGDGDLADVLGGAYVHDLDEVGDVDDGIEAFAVDLQVIADVTELLDDSGIALRIDIAGVLTGLVVVVVEGGLIGAHVRLVEEEEALNRASRFWLPPLLFGRGDDLILLATGG